MNNYSLSSNAGELYGPGINRINLAIVSNTVRHREHMRKVMERNGLNVVASESLSQSFINQLVELQADVILLDADEQMEQHGLMEQLLDSTEVPIIFNDASAGVNFNQPRLLARWYGTLMGKIGAATGKMVLDRSELDLSWQKNSEYVQTETDGLRAQEKPAQNIWILGASLGGPDALKQFFATIPAELPVAFMLVQHLGANFMGLLAAQLDRVSSFRVVPARSGHVMRHREVIVVPVNQHLQVNPIGTIELHPLEVEHNYSPSIDAVMEDMARRYTKRCNAIIFSGMCNDGVKGALAIAEQGGQVWTQDEDSCVISAMPNNVRDSGCSQFSGTPRQMAAQLIQLYRD